MRPVVSHVKLNVIVPTTVFSTWWCSSHSQQCVLLGLLKIASTSLVGTLFFWGTRMGDRGCRAIGLLDLAQAYEGVDA